MLVPENFINKSLLFIARGHPGNRWQKNAENLWILRDEYAENVPEALLKLCSQIGLKLIVLFVGKSPEFTNKKPKYSERYPNLATELDFNDINFPFSSIRRYALEIFKKRNTKNKVQNSEIFKYRGINLLKTFHYNLSDQLLPLSTSYYAHYTLYRRVFREIKPICIYGGRLDVSPALISAASDCGVPTVNVKLGIGEEMLPPLALRNENGEPDPRAIPTVSCVWGEHQKNLIASRFPDYPSKIVVSGRTRNDTFTESPSEGYLLELKKQLGVNEQSKIIVFGGTNRTLYGMSRIEKAGTSCMSPASIGEVLTALNQVAEQIGDTRIIVKPHPVDDTDVLRKIANTVSNKIILFDNSMGVHNSNLLKISTLFISSVSSMFTEALGSDCLPISFWNEDVNYLYETERRDVWSNLAITVENLEDLKSVCKRSFESPKWRTEQINKMKTVLPHYIGPFDGKNAWRTACMGLHEAFQNQSNFNLGELKNHINLK